MKWDPELADHLILAVILSALVLWLLAVLAVGHALVILLLHLRHPCS